MIEITLKLDDDVVRAAVGIAWQREFNSDSFAARHSGGAAGWDEVLRQVKLHIQTLDLSPYIAVVAKERLHSVVDEAVTIALREKAKQRAKEMTRDGTLLGNKNEN